MTSHYNLLDEPWLPVHFADGTVRLLGLLEVIRRSGEITALAETAPPSLIAEYRLLLAVVHRALVRSLVSWRDTQRAVWYRHGLPVADICAYLEDWRHRFSVFDSEYPFMQVPALANCKETEAVFPVSAISLELSYGTEMFNQEVYSDRPWPVVAVLRCLLGYFAFVPGGFFPGKKLKSSEKAGALVNTAAVLPVGETLAQTLCLALHPGPLPGAPQVDLPAWERAPLTLAELRGDPVLASGPNDRYTRQSRAVLLEPEADGQLRWLRFAAGWSLDDDAQQPDPMACFRVGANGLVRVRFSEGRAIWRDLPALLPAPNGDAHQDCQAAPVVQWAVALHRMMAGDRRHQPVLVAGLASDQAKLLRWRLEQFPLPRGLLVEPERAREVHAHVGLAEDVHKRLRQLATDLVLSTLPDSNAKDSRGRAREVVERGPLTPTYFAAAERDLWAMTELLTDDEYDAADVLWHRTLRDAAEQAWARVLRLLGHSVRALRAEARLGPRLQEMLRTKLPAAYPAARSTVQIEEV